MSRASSPGRDLLSPTLLAGLPVLAEDAAQIAPVEENRAGADPAPEDVLLAEVVEGSGDARVAARLADGEAVRQEVHLAVPRTEPPRPESLERLFDLLSEALDLIGSKVGGDELAGGNDKASVAPYLGRDRAPDEGHGLSDVAAIIGALPALTPDRWAPQEP